MGGKYDGTDLFWLPKGRLGGVNARYGTIQGLRHRMAAIKELLRSCTHPSVDVALAKCRAELARQEATAAAAPPAVVVETLSAHDILNGIIVNDAPEICVGVGIAVTWTKRRDTANASSLALTTSKRLAHTQKLLTRFGDTVEELTDAGMGVSAWVGAIETGDLNRQHHLQAFVRLELCAAQADVEKAVDQIVRGCVETEAGVSSSVKLTVMESVDVLIPDKWQEQFSYCLKQKGSARAYGWAARRGGADHSDDAEEEWRKAFVAKRTNIWSTGYSKIDFPFNADRKGRVPLNWGNMLPCIGLFRANHGLDKVGHVSVLRTVSWMIQSGNYALEPSLVTPKYGGGVPHHRVQAWVLLNDNPLRAHDLRLVRAVVTGEWMQHMEAALTRAPVFLEHRRLVEDMTFCEVKTYLTSRCASLPVRFKYEGAQRTAEMSACPNTLVLIDLGADARARGLAVQRVAELASKGRCFVQLVVLENDDAFAKDARGFLALGYLVEAVTRATETATGVSNLLRHLSFTDFMDYPTQAYNEFCRANLDNFSFWNACMRLGLPAACRAGHWQLHHMKAHADILEMLGGAANTTHCAVGRYPNDSGHYAVIWHVARRSHPGRATHVPARGGLMAAARDDCAHAPLHRSRRDALQVPTSPWQRAALRIVPTRCPASAHVAVARSRNPPSPHVAGKLFSAAKSPVLHADRNGGWWRVVSRQLVFTGSGAAPPWPRGGGRVRDVPARSASVSGPGRPRFRPGADHHHQEFKWSSLSPSGTPVAHT